jgi:hypothetical protein
MHKASPKCAGPYGRNNNGEIIVAQEMGLKKGDILQRK